MHRQSAKDPARKKPSCKVKEHKLSVWPTQTRMAPTVLSYIFVYNAIHTLGRSVKDQAHIS